MVPTVAELDADLVREAVDIVQVIGQYVQWTDTGREHKACCPFHSEKTPSFTVSNGQYYCFGCQAGGNVFQFVQGIEGLAFRDAVQRVAELGGVGYLLDSGDIRPVARPLPAKRPEGSPKARKVNLGDPVAKYAYSDEYGQLLYEVFRFEYAQDGEIHKEFKQRRPHAGGWAWGIKAGRYNSNDRGEWYPAKNGVGEVELPEVRRVLFGLPSVLAAETVCIAEGEKDALTLQRAGYCGTTHSGGSTGTWPAEAKQWLAGKLVVLLPDQDPPGRKHAERVLLDLKGLAVVRVDVPEGKDATDYADLRGIDALRELIDGAIADYRREQIEARGLLTPIEIIDLMGGVSIFSDSRMRPKGIPTGFRRLDEMTLGMFGGQQTIIGARTGVGKTALAMNIAANVCRRGGKVHVFSLEMGRDELLTRVVCAEARINSLKFRAGWLNGDERRNFNQHVDAVSRWSLKIDDGSALTTAKIAERIREHGKPDLVVIDYLQLFCLVGKSQNRTQEVGANSRALKIQSKEFRTPYLVLAQVNRSPENRPAGDGIPQLSDLRESGSIEQDADNVWFIHRPELLKPDREDLRGVAHLYIAKQRNGPRGKVNLTYVAEWTRFFDPAIDGEENE